MFDPNGLAKHGELPATWRPLTERRRVVWCRVPADGALTEAAELLADGGLTPPVHVVCGAQAVHPVLRVLDDQPDAAASLLLVNPPPEARNTGEVITLEDLPLGHPEVVAAVERATA
ncbi:hypothetical protein A4R43_15555 [Amycolatopsis albispora]|uniref:Uncharacterized protein n=1 Tax=Amycolatopsis albispora TaxID=1804986 RepID=A0A344L6U2_9PSEU|nr:hypothetical protein A4R43_15555 [Amycolatopsis albispora]